MLEYLRKFDFLGTSCSFRMNTKQTNGSWMGGLVMMIYIVFCGYYFIHESLSWIALTYTDINFQYNFIERPEIKLVDYSKFMIAICNGIESNGTNDDPIYQEALNETLQWSFSSKIPWLMKGSIDIPLKTCQSSYFPSTNNNKYSFSFFQNCKCVDPNDLKEYNISYSYKDSYTTFLSYQVMFKDYINANNTLFNYYYQYFLNSPPKNYVYFVDSKADLSSYSDFLSEFMNYQVSFINPDFYSVYDIFLSLLQIEVNDSFFFKSCKIRIKLAIQKYQKISLHKISNYFAFKENTSGNKDYKFLSVNFRASTETQRMKRTVMKFDQFCGMIMSFLSIVGLVAIQLNYFINEFEAKKMAIYKIFKGHEINHIMMKKIKIIQEDFNEFEYKENPNFNAEIRPGKMT